MGQRTAKAISEIRGSRSMRKFAADLGVMVSTVSKWESGANRPSGRNVGRLLRDAITDSPLGGRLDQVDALLEALDEDVAHFEDHILEAGGVKVIRR